MDYLENYWPCAGGFSVVKSWVTELRGLINSGLARWRMAVLMEAVAEKIRFPSSADHKQDWQPYPVDAESAESDDHKHTHAHTQTAGRTVYSL